MLELDGLTRRYGDVVALDELSLTVEDGQVLGFVGPNGAGKTTAMRIVMGVLAADQGSVRWDGGEVDAALRRRFGYMPEERGLYPKMRVGDQLRYLAELRGLGPAGARATSERWVERLGLSERSADSVEELSLGNQQRVQLGAALVHDPDLLVLDEPFAGLDPIGSDLMAEVLFERARAGAAVIFSSHQLELVERLCRSIAIIKNGRLVAAGKVDELRRGARRRRLRVELEDAERSWVDGLAGVEVAARDDGRLVLELADDVDDQRVLDAARGAGRVRHFGAELPTLAELFREVVGE